MWNPTNTIASSIFLIVFASSNSLAKKLENIRWQKIELLSTSLKKLPSSFPTGATESSGDASESFTKRCFTFGEEKFLLILGQTEMAGDTVNTIQMYDKAQAKKAPSCKEYKTANFSLEDSVFLKIRLGMKQDEVLRTVKSHGFTGFVPGNVQHTNPIWSHYFKRSDSFQLIPEGKTKELSFARNQSLHLFFSNKSLAAFTFNVYEVN